MAEGTVYVVDDDHAVRDSIRRLARSVGVACETFGSARAFLEAFPPDGPSCLIVDVRMPEMSGLELQEELACRGCRVPIIVMTGFGDVPMAVRSLRAGAVDFLEKPFASQELLDRIRAALDEHARFLRHERECRVIFERLALLSPREREVLDLVANHGLTSRQIAADLGLSPKTVHAHRSELMTKMRAGGVAELTRMVVTARVLAGDQRPGT